MLWAIIMAGGSGERFWPKSRQKKPKQLLTITSQRTLIQLTQDRLRGWIAPSHILVITQAIHRDAVLEQLPEIPSDNVIAEPVGRNTAPCIALTALLIQEKDPDATLLVLPADHLIHDKDSFQKSLQTSIDFVDLHPETLMTFAILPDYPATSYGYLHTEEEKPGNASIRKVSRFVEKPNLLLAQEYLKNGGYFWNSGIFVWKAKAICKEIQTHMPVLAEDLKHIQSESKKTSLSQALEKNYPLLENQSIDFGVMEKSKNVFACIASFDWDDMGSWETIGKHFQADTEGNVSIGQVELLHCKNMLVYNMSEKDLLATAIDMEDHILVQTEDAVMVCPKTATQKVKALLQKIRRKKWDRFL
jgi:mannose-1-phosphate guanylyltransferase